MVMRITSIVAVALVFVSVLVAPSVSGQESIVGNTLTINGMQMYYEEAGNDPPLLLLHNFGGCA